MQASLSEEYFEEQIKETANSEDPLAAYIAYHSWSKATKKQKKQQTLIVSRAIQKFRNDPRYKQDNRFIRFCTLYAQLLGNPIEYFDYLSRKKIGTQWALFYEAKALFQEKENLLTDAAATYEKGIRLRAKPLDRLKKNYNAFKKRVAAKELVESVVEADLRSSEPVEMPSVSCEYQYEENRAKLWKSEEQQRLVREEELAKQLEIERLAKEREDALRKLEQQKIEEERLQREAARKEQEFLEKQKCQEEERLKHEAAVKEKEMEEQRKHEEEERLKREAAIKQKEMEEQRQEQERIEKELVEQRRLEAREREETLRKVAEQKIEEERLQREAARMEQELLEKLKYEEEVRLKHEEEERLKYESVKVREQEEQWKHEEERLKCQEREFIQETEYEQGKNSEVQDDREQAKTEQQIEELRIAEVVNIHDKEPIEPENERVNINMSTEIEAERQRLEQLRLEEEMQQEIPLENEELKQDNKFEFLALEVETEIDSLSDADELVEELSFEEQLDDHEIEPLQDVSFESEKEFQEELSQITSNSMFNIINRTSNINGTICIPESDATLTLFSNRANHLLNEAFCGPIEDSEESEESEDSENTHLHGFTGHIPTMETEDPLAPITVCQDSPAGSMMGNMIGIPSTTPNSFIPYQDDVENDLPLRELPLGDLNEEPISILTDPLPVSEYSQDFSHSDDEFIIFTDAPSSIPSIIRDSEEYNDVDGNKENAMDAFLSENILTEVSGSFDMQVNTSEDDLDDDGDNFLVEQTEIPGSSFSIFQDINANPPQHNSPEDIFALIETENERYTLPSSQNTTNELPLFSEAELNETISSAGAIHPYTHEHAMELQCLPIFQAFLQQQMHNESYKKIPAPAPVSTKLQEQARPMRSANFQEEDYEEFPLFENDCTSTKASILSLGPCIGSGGFAKVFLAQHFLEIDEEQDTMFIEDTRRAIKYQKHSRDPWTIRWEFYIMSVIQSRLPRLSACDYKYNFNFMAQRFCSALFLREFEDCSFLMLSYMDQGTLLDVINAHRSKKRKIDELLIAFLSLEIFTILYYLHRCKIIHGDIKPDNFLFMNAPSGATWEEWNICGENSWKFRGLQLIDFGRAIDLSLYADNQHQQFCGDNHVDAFQSIEMKHGSNWSYQVDLYGACAIIHLLLHLEPMEVVHKKPSKKCLSLQGVSDRDYALPKEKFKLTWSYNWELLFLDLLHVSSSSMCLELLGKHIQQLQSFVGVNSKKIRVALSKEHTLMRDQGF